MSRRTRTTSFILAGLLPALGTFVGACETAETNAPVDPLEIEPIEIPVAVAPALGPASPSATAAATMAPEKKPEVMLPRDRDPAEEKRKMARSKTRSDAARKSLRSGNLDRAVTEARDALRIHEQNVSAMLTVAEVFYKRGRYEIVQSVTSSVLSVNPAVLSDSQRSQAHNLKGFSFLAEGKRPLAMQAFKTAAELDDKNAAAWNNVGVQYAWLGDDKTAAGSFEYATQLDPGFSNAHLNLGAALRGLGQYQEAKRAFDKVLKLKPKSAEAHFNLGVLYLDAPSYPGLDTQARLRKAITEFGEFRRLASRGPSSSDVGAPTKKDDRGLGNELVGIEQADLYVEVAKKQIERDKRRGDRERKLAEQAAKDALERAKAEAEERRKAAAAPPPPPTPVPAVARPGQANPVRPSTQRPGAVPAAGPQTTPQAPAAKPQTPTAKPQTPTAKPQTPTAKPQTPTAKPQTPTAKPQTPTAKPQTPTAKPQTPTAKPQTPAPQRPGAPGSGSAPTTQRPTVQRPGS